MADTTKVQLVSSPTNGPSSPPLTPPAHDTSTSSDSFVELSIADDAISLQDMIDSELALRISTDTIEDDPEDEPSVEVKPLEVKKLDLLNLDVDEDDSSIETKVPKARMVDMLNRNESEDSEPHEVKNVDLLNLNFTEEVSVESPNVKNVDLLNLDVAPDLLNTSDEVPIETKVTEVTKVDLLNLDVEETEEANAPEVLKFDLIGDERVDLSNGHSEQHQIDSIDWEPQIVEATVSDGGGMEDGLQPLDSVEVDEGIAESPVHEREVVDGIESPVEITNEVVGLVREHVAVKSPEDINTKFILAEQADQLELTEADIVFFNTFNQVQSNGDDSVSSPDVSVESPKEPVATLDFDPFATIPLQDLESPIFEAGPETFPSPNRVDQNDDAKPPETSAVDSSNDSSSNRADFDNRMDVFTSSNLDTKIILNNLTHPEQVCSVNKIADVFPTETLDTKERMAIPEIGITPPDPVDYDDEDDECLTEEAGEEFDSWTKVSEVEVDVPQPDVPPPVVQVEEHDVCINAQTSDSESSEAVSSGSVEKKTKKKKSEAVNGDVNKTKRNKKNKKEEKENISVVSPMPTTPTSPASEALSDDIRDLSNVSVKELKQTYCSEATKGFGRPEVNGRKESFRTGVSIKELRRSFGDLTNIGDDVGADQPACKATASDSVNAKPTLSKLTLNRAHSGSVAWQSRSMGDLRSLSIESNASAEVVRPAIVTGVSVRELAASYCSLAQVKDLRPITPLTPSLGRRTAQQPEKSSFSKFDALSKKTVLHVRSGDASKAQKQFSQVSAGGEGSTNCKSCSKQVFAMEQVKAERCIWHKNCFRCQECSKQLTVDAYSSHEGVLYCRPHFKELFQPKVVVEEEQPIRRRKAGPIISENQPTELPPEVVRGSDKPDLGLEELSALNVKSRFQAFEQLNEDSNLERSPSAIVNVKRSPSILSKLARFQAKGMDVGVTDDSLNGVPVGESSSSEEEEDELEGVDKEVVRANRKHRERPVSFSKMEDIKGRWESGASHRREDRREERKQEISTIRSRLFMGHQGKMKEAYQQAVTESTAGKELKKDVDVCSDRARSIKERFERGDVVNSAGDDDDQRKAIEEDLVDAGYTKKSRSLFLELDASAVKLAPVSPPKSGLGRDESFRKTREFQTLPRQVSEDVVRASDTQEEVQVETADIGNRFKFFETFRPTEREKRTFRITPPREGTVKAEQPEREIYRDPTIVRADDKVPDQEVMRSQTASKMLSFFKSKEEQASKEEVPLGPKPLKRFTPPPDCELNRDSGSSDEDESSEEEEEDEGEEQNPNIIRSSDKVEDESLKAAQTAAARAKTLRAKFERWEEREVERERSTGILDGMEITAEQAEQSSLDTTKSLRARFESMSHEQQRNGTADKQPRPKVNRFVEIQTSCAEFCFLCKKKVYQLEKVDTGKMIFHKNCFRCVHCNCILRMDSYTLNSGRLYCIPHFKQIFFAKGNYEEGFGIDLHSRKWATNKSDDILLSPLAVD